MPKAFFLLVRKCHAQMAEFAWASLRICAMCSADFLWNTCSILQKRSRGICDPWDIAVTVWCAVLFKYVRMPFDTLRSVQSVQSLSIPFLFCTCAFLHLCMLIMLYCVPVLLLNTFDLRSLTFLPGLELRLPTR